MKKMKTIFLASMMLLVGKTYAQSQLSRWHIAPDAVNFLTPSPSKITGFAPTTISAYNKAYNSVCDNAGNLIFYIANGTIYNKLNVALGTIPIHSTSTEIAIIPNPGNFTNPCQEKYYIVFPQTGSLVLNITYAEVDITSNTFTFTNPVIGLTGATTNPMAVSKVTPSGKRYLYFGAAGFGVGICEVDTTSINSVMGSVYSASPDGMEMELSDAGDKLAFTKSNSGNHDLIVVSLNPANGLPVGSPVIYNTGSGAINGLELNNTGTKVFYSKSSSGVYWQDLLTTTFTSNLISGTSSFGNGMLEKIYGGNEIACASSTQLRGITTGTGPALSSTLSYVLPFGLSGFSGAVYLMPDQIDGEDYDAGKSKLFPVITGPASFCFNPTAPFLAFDGSASYGTLNSVVTPGIITNHVWIISECNPTGIPFGPDFWVWGSGAPIPFTFPATMPGGPIIQCGKHYLIKLALQNCDVVWAETTKKIEVLCPPTIDLGPDQNICLGDCITIQDKSPGPKKKRTYSWYTLGGISSDIGGSDDLSNGNSIVVCPTTNTVYCGTVTSTATGCSTTDCITVFVETADPSFSITDNTSNSSYLTLQAFPNVTAVPVGFQHFWVVEELDAGLNTIFTLSSFAAGTCWNSFPTYEDFSGFDGLTSAFNSSCIPAIGQYKYNTFYRITRVAWSDNCPKKQMSKIITSTPPGAIGDGTGGHTDIFEDGNAPDLTHVHRASSVQHSSIAITKKGLNLFPNPANNLLNIEYKLSDKISGKILITDLAGRTLKTIVLTEGTMQTQVDISELTNGVYFVSLYESDKRTATEKIIVTR